MRRRRSILFIVLPCETTFNLIREFILIFYYCFFFFFQCEWPFGHTDFIFIQRKVGNTWSCYWDDLNLKKMNNYVPVSTELTLYTPPETPSTDSVVKELLSGT